MSPRSLTEHEDAGAPSTRSFLRLVIPAHRKSRFVPTELAWIPAFAGMT
jgi:hypothetical protein